VDVVQVLGDVAILPIPVKRIVLDILVEKRTSVVTSKAAIRGHFKTGHSDWPKT